MSIPKYELARLVNLAEAELVRCPNCGIHMTHDEVKDEYKCNGIGCPYNSDDISLKRQPDGKGGMQWVRIEGQRSIVLNAE